MNKNKQEDSKSSGNNNNNNNNNSNKNSNNIDFQGLGFKCGIEIHQQLDTGKLFCDCQSIVHDNNPRIIAKRKLKAVIGETGEIDIAAKHEEGKARTYVYEGCPNSYCLVELDEEPPHSMNMKAVNVALQLAKMCHCEIVDEIQVMRKTVIDGSNVSGFQRTALVGKDGYIETTKGKVPIQSICVEEESAKKIKAEGNEIIYRLDRLGVPLIEIATDASLKDGEHAKEAAGILGMMLRSTGKARRGLGSIRQDVNISIKNGQRTEVKGFQDIKSIPKVIEFEIMRQQSLIENKETVKKEVRKAEADMTTSFLRPMPGAARMYPETDVLPIRITKKIIDSIELPKLISDIKSDLITKYKFDPGIVDDIVKQEIDFDSYVSKFKDLEPILIATVLIQIPKEIKRKDLLDTDSLTESDFAEILGYLNNGSVTKDVVSELIIKKIKKEKINIDDYKGIDNKILEAEIKKMIEEKPNLNIGGYMGLVMAKFKGKVDGKLASAIIAKLKK